MDSKNGFGKTLEQIRAMKRTVHRLERTVIRAGWIDGARTLDGRTEFAVIARTLCYGREEGTTSKGWKYPAIPARNFMRRYGEKYEKDTLREAGLCLRAAFGTGKGSDYQADLNQVLAPIGARASGGLREAIVHERYEANARSTVMSWAKRHSGSTRQMRAAGRLNGEAQYTAYAGMKKELVDTGALVQHITYNVGKK